MSIDELVQEFEQGTLPRSLWTHAAHLSVALWYLHHYDRDEATRRLRDGIQSYNARQDNPRGYHETITLAWIEVVTAFLRETSSELPLNDLQRRLLDLCHDSDLLLRWYSRERLSSESARREWLPPDRSAIDLTGL